MSVYILIYNNETNHKRERDDWELDNGRERKTRVLSGRRGVCVWDELRMAVETRLFSFSTCFDFELKIVFCRADRVMCLWWTLFRIISPITSSTNMSIGKRSGSQKSHLVQTGGSSLASDELRRLGRYNLTFGKRASVEKFAPKHVNERYTDDGSQRRRWRRFVRVHRVRFLNFRFGAEWSGSDYHFLLDLSPVVVDFAKCKLRW